MCKDDGDDHDGLDHEMLRAHLTRALGRLQEAYSQSYVQKSSYLPPNYLHLLS